MPLEPEQVMSTPTYAHLARKQHTKESWNCAKVGHKQKWTLPVLALRGRYYVMLYLYYMLFKHKYMLWAKYKIRSKLKTYSFAHMHTWKLLWSKNTENVLKNLKTIQN